MAMKLNLSSDFFNKKYLPYLNDNTRTMVFMGGAGSGKSHFVTQRAILKSLKSKRRTLVVRKVQATIRDSVFKLFVDQLIQMDIYKFCKVTTSNLSIKLPNGSEFIFKGMDDPEKIKSITGIDDIIIEEATEVTLDDFSQLNLRLRSGADNQQIILMFNPVSKENWVYPYFFKQKPRDTVIVKTTYKDNRFLPFDYVKSLKAYKATNPLYYQVYCLGNFGNLGKKVFENWKEETFDVNQLIKDNTNLKTCIAIDFGLFV
ncbi:MAG: PBSX family phage terminase large subunit [Carnobacterium sp.]|uniref:PBSX family phage terminase large subunit n=1 Tax=Carnobacterium sp. TaxID=48221 RepID=UPI003C71EE23